MKKSFLLSMCLPAIIFFPLIACGLAPVSKDSVATQAAATIYAGETDQAKASSPAPAADTPTPRPSATPTSVTPTSTPGPTLAPPTATPTRTATSPPTDTAEPKAVPELGEDLTCADVFREDFARPSRDWPSGSDRYGRWGPTQGEYQIMVREADYLFSRSNGLLAADFVLEMDARYVSDNFGAYGLMFGLNSLANGQDFYAFFVDPEGYFALFSHTDDRWATVVNWTYSPALVTGKGVNRLRVERRGDAISLSANGQLLVITHDATYMGTRHIALVTETFDVGDVDVRFDNIVACLSPTWPAATPTPPATPTPVPQPASPPAPPAMPTPAPPSPTPEIFGKGALVMFNCRGDVVTVDVIPAGVFQELAPKTGPDCRPGEPIPLDPGDYILRASIAGVPSKGEATITIVAGTTLRFTWY